MCEIPLKDVPNLQSTTYIIRISDIQKRRLKNASRKAMHDLYRLLGHMRLTYIHPNDTEIQERAETLKILLQERPSLRKTVHTLQNTSPLLLHLQLATSLNSPNTGKRALNLDCTKHHTKCEFHETFMKQNLHNPLYPSHTHGKLNLTSFNAHVRRAIDAASLSQSNTSKPQEISWSTLPRYHACINFRKLCSEQKRPDLTRSSAARPIMNDLNTKMPHTHEGK